MIRVVVVDDQEMVREGFSALLDAQDDIEVVGAAGNGVQGVALARAVRPDVVLMDIRMPEMDGLTATRLLLNGSDEVKVLVLTTFDLDDYVYEAIRAGASGFLLKTTPPHQLIEGIRAVMSGDALLAPTITRRLLDRFIQRPPPSSTTPPELAELTPRELEVLRLIAGGHSNAEIAANLFLSAATVKSHVNHLLTKLGLRDRVQAVALAYRTGLMDQPR